MKKLQKIKLEDLTNESTKVEVDEMQKIVGGFNSQFLLADGCQSGICSVKINTSYCDGGAVCTSGIAG